MKSYVINLEKDLERRLIMTRRLSDTPFSDAEFVKGVDGRTIHAAKINDLFELRRFNRTFEGVINRGEIGCTLSHYHIWERMACDNKSAIIFEDDLKFNGDWTAALSFLKRWLDSRKPRIALLTHHFDYYRWTLRHEKEGIDTVRPIRAWGTVCYGINAAAARLLTGLGRPFYVADSWDFFKSKGIDIRAIVQHPVIVDFSFESNIPQRTADLEKRIAYICLVPGMNTDVIVPRMLYTGLLYKAKILIQYRQE